MGQQRISRFPLHHACLVFGACTLITGLTACGHPDFDQLTFNRDTGQFSVPIERNQRLPRVGSQR